MSKMINLGKSNESVGISVPESVKDSIHYPSLYLNGENLGLDEEDLNEEMEATIKVKVTRITKTTENGATRESVDLEVMGIKFDDKE